MSGLNLIPNPTVLAVQTGVFMANIFVIKKLWLDPYMKVYEKRKASTTGSQSDAEKIGKENDKMVTKIETGIHDAVEESRKIRTDIHSKTSFIF